MNTELEKINNWYIANKLTLNFDKTSAILFSNSKNAQLSCPDVYFKFGSSNERIKETNYNRTYFSFKGGNIPTTSIMAAF